MSMDDDLSLLKALSEETRYKILKLLLQGERCACEIPGLIERTQSNTSMHLSKLQKWGILKSRRQGKRIVYEIADRRICDVFKALGNKDGNILKKGCCCSGGKI